MGHAVFFRWLQEQRINSVTLHRDDYMVLRLKMFSQQVAASKTAPLPPLHLPNALRPGSPTNAMQLGHAADNSIHDGCQSAVSGPSIARVSPVGLRPCTILLLVPSELKSCLRALRAHPLLT